MLYEETKNVQLKLYTDAQASKIPVNGVVIKEEAWEIAQRLKIDFSSSNDWMNIFKERHNLVFVTVHEKSGGVNMETLKKMKKKITSNYKRTLIKRYFQRWQNRVVL